MTDDEKTVLTQYLIRLGALPTPADFEEWYRESTDSAEGEAATVTLLANARAYDLGLRDANVQAEALVAGIHETYQLVIKELIAGRTRGSVSPGSNWFPLAVSPCRAGGTTALGKWLKTLGISDKCPNRYVKDCYE